MFLCFQDFPYIPTVVVMVLFSLLRMAEICENPFDYDNYYDVHIKEEIDIQLFIGSLALYQDTPPILTNGPSASAAAPITLDDLRNAIHLASNPDHGHQSNQDANPMISKASTSAARTDENPMTQMASESSGTEHVAVQPTKKVPLPMILPKVEPGSLAGSSDIPDEDLLDESSSDDNTSNPASQQSLPGPSTSGQPQVQGPTPPMVDESSEHPPTAPPQGQSSTQSMVGASPNHPPEAPSGPPQGLTPTMAGSTPPQPPQTSVSSQAKAPGLPSSLVTLLGLPPNQVHPPFSQPPPSRPNSRLLQSFSQVPPVTPPPALTQADLIPRTRAASVPHAVQPTSSNAMIPPPPAPSTNVTMPPPPAPSTTSMMPPPAPASATSLPPSPVPPPRQRQVYSFGLPETSNFTRRGSNSASKSSYRTASSTQVSSTTRGGKYTEVPFPPTDSVPGSPNAPSTSKRYESNRKRSAAKPKKDEKKDDKKKKK